MSMPERVGALRRAVQRALSRRSQARSPRPFLQLVTLKIIDVEALRTQAELAERLMAEPPTINRLVARLVRDGLVTRTPGKDRRTVVLSLTSAGRREVKVFQDAVAGVDRVLRDALGQEEYDTLLRLMRRAEQVLESDRG